MNTVCFILCELDLMPSMWCLVSQPNSVVIEVEVDPKANGQQCLEKVCACLGISSESDYFGLKYHSMKAPDVWLNLRNPIDRQGVAGVPPYRFALRVKFWVPPHILLQATTRHQFYLNARLDLLEGRLKVPSAESAVKMVALVAQAESGDLEQESAPLSIYTQWCQLLLADASQDKMETVVRLHRDMWGMKSSTSEYWLLKEISSLGGFGEELFHCKNTVLGIGPHGINVYCPSTQACKSIPYTSIHSAVSQRRSFQLHYDDTTLELKCESSLAATELYRALTEKHAFYSCETVRGAVTSQFVRDLKGTIASIFNEATPLGKQYVFDIRRTCREVHDNARRALYRPDAVPVPDGPASDAVSGSTSERLARLLDALTCRICMDASIDTVFFPCAHVVACCECSTRCESCPLCRASIQESKRVYLPTLEHDFQGSATTSSSSHAYDKANDKFKVKNCCCSDIYKHKIHK